jgi:hypothetical protein
MYLADLPGNMREISSIEGKWTLSGVRQMPIICPLEHVHSSNPSTARGKMWAALSGTFCIETKMEMPPRFCRMRYFSSFLYGNGNIATV